MDIIARGVGRRKEAVAQIQIVKASKEFPGGQFLINNIPAENYLHNNTCSLLSIKAPLNVLSTVHDVRIEGETQETSLNTEMLDDSKFSLNNLNSFNTVVKVKGGGLVGQAEAIRLGLAKAICQFYSITASDTNQITKELNQVENALSIDESSSIKSNGLGYEAEIRKQFKDKGYLTQDSRVKERRKYGLKKARKASQYHKR